MSVLYQQLLGSEWEILDPSVRAFHELEEPRRASGVFSVKRGKSLLARPIQIVGKLPHAGFDVPVLLEVIPQRDGERWPRSFAGRAFVTQQRRGRTNLLLEDIGALRISYRLTVREGALHFEQVGAALRLGAAGLPLPAWLAPQISAHEWPDRDGGSINVGVRVVHRFCGTVIEYEGRIQMENQNQ